MLNKPNSHSEYTIQNEVTQYPVGFEFFFNGDDTPQVLVKIGGVKMDLNVHYKFSEDLSTLILIPLEEEKPTDPNDYSWLNKWVGEELVIEREIEFVQESDYQVGRISPEQIEKDFDASVMRDQILLDRIGEHTTDVAEELESLHTDISDINAELATKATKTELDNYKLTANAAIDANATAIQKTREDFASADQNIRADMNAKDSELETILNDHTKRLNTLRTDHDDLGDDVSDIQAKIPESASGSNPLITKQQLLNEELDIRKDLNSGLSELQTQVTAQAAKIETKQDKLIAGDNIVIGSDGKTISATGAGGGAGLSFIVYDTLPETGESGIIYLVPKDSEAPDVYDEYVWITATSTFELIGSTQVDLTDYAKKEDVATAVSDRLPLSGGTLTGAINYNVGELPSYIWKDAPLFTSSFTSPGGVLAFNEVGLYASANGLCLGAKTEQTCLLVFNVISNKIEPGTTNRAELGTSSNLFKSVATKKLISGIDTSDYSINEIIVPEKKGTMALLEDLENIDALPDQTGNAGKFLTTDGETASWQEPSGGTTITLKEYDE